jgi:glycosyltransferase involved in cell wall biosynthesis
MKTCNESPIMGMREASRKETFVVIGFGASRNGGIPEVTMQIITALRSRGARVWEVNLSGPRFQRVTGWARLTLALLLGMRPIVMHGYLFEACRLLRPLCRDWVVWAHGIEVWGTCGLRRTPSLGQASLVVAVSEFTAMQLSLRDPSLPVVIVHPCAMCAGRKRTWPLPEAAEIVTVARLSASEGYKGHDMTIRAIHLLQSRGIRVTYHVIGRGDPSEVDRLSQLALSLGVSRQVIFHGFLPDNEVSRLYGSCCAFVMPSRVTRRDDGLWGGEGFGIVYLEAAMHELPSVACNEGGQTDVIVHGKTGLLVDPRPEEVADAIEKLCDSNVSHQMGVAARCRAEAEFNFDSFTQRLWAALAREMDASPVRSLQGRSVP